MAFVVHFSPLDGRRVSSPNPKKKPWKRFADHNLNEAEIMISVQHPPPWNFGSHRTPTIMSSVCSNGFPLSFINLQ